MVVGAIGFIVDTLVFALTLAQTGEPYSSRFIAFLVAVTTTFFLNKHITFAFLGGARFARYLATQTGGVIINMLVFVATIYHPILLPAQYYFGLAAGAVAAMAFNYKLSRHYVFN